MAVINDPIMGLTIPIPNSESGSAYASEISNDLQFQIAQHRHTGQSNLDGYQIPSAGLNINADLSIQSHNLTSIRSVRFANQSTTLSGSGDVDCLYVDGNNLYFNNGSGLPIQMTSGSGLLVLTSNVFARFSMSANHTINATDSYVYFECATNTAAMTLTLPLASSVSAGQFYWVKDTGGNAYTNNVTVAPNGTDTIDGYNANFLLDWAYGSLFVVSNGSTGWDLHLFKARPQQIKVNSSPYTVKHTKNELQILCDTSGGALTVNLPSASSVTSDTKVIIKDTSGNASTNNITIVPSGSDTIEGLNANKLVQVSFGMVSLSPSSVINSTSWIMQ